MCLLKKGIIKKNNKESETKMDGSDKCGIENKPAGDGQLKKTPDHRNRGDDIF